MSARNRRGAAAPIAALVLCALAGAPLATGSPAAAASPPAVLPAAAVRDVEARDRLFQRGLPVAPESFSPTGDHFAHLHYVRGGWLKRRPVRCAFVLDLATAEHRAVPTPEGTAERLGGWDPTGRYLLVEATSRGLLYAFTGDFTTYHWVWDAVTATYVSRRPFTGMRDGQRFRWKAPDLYHGVWNEDHEAQVVPLYEGELARQYEAREAELAREDERRQALAARLAVRQGDGPLKPLVEVLERLDTHWTQRGQRDPVISDLFGDRPHLDCRFGDEWVRITEETEHVAVLDRGLALITRHGGRQLLLNADANEVLPLPPPPTGWVEVLDTRWDRTGGYYDEGDPLPRDLQYRRSWDAAGGTAMYFNYVLRDRSRVLVLYPFDGGRRVLRVVDLPASWSTAGDATAGDAAAGGAAAAPDSAARSLLTPSATPDPPAG